jgi:AcrR family transcriptional regulator
MATQAPIERASKWVNPAVQLRSQETLARILDATERLLTERSFQSISVAEIAKAAGASPPSLYARFENKQALLGALFERHAAAQRVWIKQILAAEVWRDVPLAAMLRQTLPAIVEVYRAKQGLIRAFLEQAASDARFRAEWQELGKFLQERAIEIVLDHRGELSHDNPRRRVELGLEVVIATFALRIVLHTIDDKDMNELAELLTQIMLRHLGVADLPKAGA